MRGLLLAVVLAVLAAMPAAAQMGCLEPIRPSVPDGDFAADYEMTAMETEMELYLRHVDDYTACMKREIAALRQQIAETRSEAKVTVNEWKRALRAYKSR